MLLFSVGCIQLDVEVGSTKKSFQTLNTCIADAVKNPVIAERRGGKNRMPLVG